MGQPVFLWNGTKPEVYLDNVIAKCKEAIKTESKRYLESALYSACYRIISVPCVELNAGASVTLGYILKQVDFDDVPSLRHIIEGFVKICRDMACEQDYKMLLLFEGWVPVCELLGLPVSLLYSALALCYVRLAQHQSSSVVCKLANDVLEHEEFFFTDNYYKSIRGYLL